VAPHVAQHPEVAPAAIRQRIYRFTKFEIYGEQDRIAAPIWRALGR
jgi:hypothetical protein